MTQEGEGRGVCVSASEEHSRAERDLRALLSRLVSQPYIRSDYLSVESPTVSNRVTTLLPVEADSRSESGQVEFLTACCDQL